MRIGVISDTHITSFNELPGKLLSALAGVDLIVHTGDFVAIDVLEGLRRIGEVKAVRGNMDSYELKQLLPETEFLIVNGRRIGIIHGWGSPFGIEDRVREKFSDVDIIIFGHSHQPKNELKQGIFFFNPGQARHSFGILTIEEEVKGEIIEI